MSETPRQTAERLAAELFPANIVHVHKGPVDLAKPHRDAFASGYLARDAEAHKDHCAFTASLGFGDGVQEPSATYEQMLGPLQEWWQAMLEHNECPRHCALCGDRLASERCPDCHGSGCLSNPQLAYLECDECGGEGWIHPGCVEKSYGDLAEEVAEPPSVSAEQVEKAEKEYQRAYTAGVLDAPSRRNGITPSDAKKICQNAMTAAFRAAGLLTEGD